MAKINETTFHPNFLKISLVLMIITIFASQQSCSARYLPTRGGQEDLATRLREILSYIEDGPENSQQQQEMEQVALLHNRPALFGMGSARSPIYKRDVEVLDKKNLPVYGEASTSNKVPAHKVF